MSTGSVQQPSCPPYLPVLRCRKSTYRPGKERVVDDGDFQDVGVVGDENQWPLERYLRKLTVINSTEKLGHKLRKGVYKST
jgi:hypothetical protein